MLNNKRLSLIYNKKIKIADLTLEKETVVKKRADQYDFITSEGIRYLIFEDKGSEKGYIILGKKLEGGKFKNYFLGEIGKESVLGLSESKEVNPESMHLCLKNMVSKIKNHKQKFYDFVSEEYGINYAK